MANTTDHHLPTIVYVEDNVGDAILLEDALRERGHRAQLVVIERGDKAMHYLTMKATARDIPPPHCILLDAFLPMVTGAQILRYIRNCRVFDDTPVYIFAPEADYAGFVQSLVISKESFITKASNWDEMLNLADLLMSSAEAKRDNTTASDEDSRPEVHAEGALRRQDTTQQRARTQAGPPGPQV